MPPRSALCLHSPALHGHGQMAWLRLAGEGRAAQSAARGAMSRLAWPHAAAMQWATLLCVLRFGSVLSGQGITAFGKAVGKASIQQLEISNCKLVSLQPAVGGSHQAQGRTESAVQPTQLLGTPSQASCHNPASHAHVFCIHTSLAEGGVFIRPLPASTDTPLACMGVTRPRSARVAAAWQRR